MHTYTTKKLFLSRKELKARNLVPNDFVRNDLSFPERSDGGPASLVAAKCTSTGEEGDSSVKYVWYYANADTKPQDFSLTPDGCEDLRERLSEGGIPTPNEIARQLRWAVNEGADFAIALLEDMNAHGAVYLLEEYKKHHYPSSDKVKANYRWTAEVQ